MKKSKHDSDKTATKLSSDQVKEITDFIQRLKTDGTEPSEIRKQVFKKFKIDTAQWELNWEPSAKKVKGGNKNERVAKGSELVTTSNTSRRNEPINFKYEFNEGEINERANILAQLEMDREQLEDQKKNVASEFKSKIEEKETAIGKVAREIHSGFEMRNETCEVIRDFDNGTKKSYYRGKLVKDEKLTAPDYTLQFPEDHAA